MSPELVDPVRELRDLLAQGRFQEVLDRYAKSAADPAFRGPGVDLAVATAATRLGKLTDGETLARSALGAFRAKADDDGRVRTLNLLGAISFERGRLTEAVTSWNLALDLSRSANDAFNAAQVSNNLASVLHLQGRVAEAQSLYREAMIAYQRLADRRGMSGVSHNLAVTFRWADDRLMAEEADAEAVRQAEAVGDESLQALAITGQAETLIEDGDFNLAKGQLTRAERLAERANDALGTVDVNRVRAELWLRSGELDQALDSALAGRARAIEVGSLQLQGECAAVLFRILKQVGRVEQSEAYRAEARQIFLSLGAAGHLRRLDQE